jgi:arylsulfatase
MAYTFDKANAQAPSTHHVQYFEIEGNRGIYKDGWYANTQPIGPPWKLTAQNTTDVMTGYKWELYDLTKDWTQHDDLAAANPDKLKEMQDLFMAEAAKYQVFPLDNTLATRLVTPRPTVTAGRTEFTYSGTLLGVPLGGAPKLLDTSYTITAEVDVPKAAEGVIATQGGRFSGWGFYLLKGRPVYVWNLLDLKRTRWEGPALSPGKHTLVFDFKYDGLGLATLAYNNISGLGRSATGVLKVDGKEVARKTMDKTLPLVLQWDETFDVGADTGTSVDEKYYEVPFKFTGTIDKLTIKVDPPKLSAEDERRLMESQRNNKSSE